MMNVEDNKTELMKSMFALAVFIAMMLMFMMSCYKPEELPKFHYIKFNYEIVPHTQYGTYGLPFCSTENQEVGYVYIHYGSGSQTFGNRIIGGAEVYLEPGMYRVIDFIVYNTEGKSIYRMPSQDINRNGFYPSIDTEITVRVTCDPNN